MGFYEEMQRKLADNRKRTLQREQYETIRDPILARNEVGEKNDER